MFLTKIVLFIIIKFLEGVLISHVFMLFMFCTRKMAQLTVEAKLKKRITFVLQFACGKKINW